MSNNKIKMISPNGHPYIMDTDENNTPYCSFVPVSNDPNELTAQIMDIVFPGWDKRITPETTTEQKPNYEKETQKKFELTSNNKTTPDGKTTLYQIRAVKEFRSGCSVMGHVVKAGELGGWVEKENNLSQEGLCWISEEAMVYGNARVSGNAIVSKEAMVYGDAMVYDRARIAGKAQVYDRAKVYDEAEVYGGAKIFENAIVCEEARICSFTEVYGYTKIATDSISCNTEFKLSTAWVLSNCFEISEIKVNEAVEILKMVLNRTPLKNETEKTVINKFLEALGGETI